MADAGNNHVEDYEQIIKEWKEELDIKARIPAVAKAEVEKEYGEPQEPLEVVDDDNGAKPKIDNNAKGKSITE